MIVADTNVVSEFMRQSPDPAVLDWARGIAAVDLGICVVTVEEIERGLGSMADGRRRRDLQRRWDGLVVSFGESIVPYDVNAARATAAIIVDAERGGHPIPLADAQIAGICAAGGHRLATRNVKHFATVEGLDVINPFEQGR